MYSTPSTWINGFHDPNYEGKLQYGLLGQTGLVVSKLGFGGSAIGGIFSLVNDNESISVVRQALKTGINYIDTAPWYGDGKAEIVLGKALEGVPREAYYIATKIGRYKPNVADMFDFSAQRTFQSVDESLSRLKLDYVDVLQVHDLEFAANLDVIINETLPALQKIKEIGKAKFIGITGYPIKTLMEVVEKSSVQLDTVLSYCRCCLVDSSLLDYIDFFKVVCTHYV
uniref:NADP-dependent oxidoreductase domain-containing protein n=1 Tax=Strigamia maritima TaxID=126957 RepID=T1IMR7_STRMM